MFNIIKKEINWNGKSLSIETGRIARQATGSCLLKYGNTTLLATTVVAKDANPDLDFFPLTVHYIEKYYASGKIPGGFLKRETKPKDHEILIARLIDRPIRPLFKDGFKNEVNILVQTLSYDPDTPVDVLAILAASASLAIANVPMEGIVGAAKVGLIDDSLVINPDSANMSKSALEIVIAGTEQGVLMVESEAKELSEEKMLEAISIAHSAMQEPIALIKEISKEVNKAEWDIIEPSEDEISLQDAIKDISHDKLIKAYEIKSKQDRASAIDEIKEESIKNLIEKGFDEELVSLKFSSKFKDLQKDIVRGAILERGDRIDGRDLSAVRPIVCEVSEFPNVHGSAIFTRGETQAIVITTLGSKDDEQMVDDLNGLHYDRFLLHYNFPPYSVGEVGALRAPGRREIGHGKLAWRAINPVLPSADDFPYTIRAVSEITESNGSSSMATVCGTSMSLMSAGVPVKPVAGVAMGLIKENDNFAVLTDILGDEDHLGDMDFKVAGTSEGITSLQMDIKITSITNDIMKIALDKAKDARMHIMQEMAKAIQEPASISKNAPVFANMNIPKDTIKDVIGSGGKVIKEICEKYEVKIDIEDNGALKIYGKDSEKVEQAKEFIVSLTASPEDGKVYDAVITKVLEFGAFARFFGKQEGLIHISEITNEHVDNVRDFFNEGDSTKVRFIGTDRKGKNRLSVKDI